jgi:hypothetical protein
MKQNGMVHRDTKNAYDHYVEQFWQYNAPSKDPLVPREMRSDAAKRLSELQARETSLGTGQGTGPRIK